jgi:hypothetical protein
MPAIQFVAESLCIIFRRFAHQSETAAQSGFGVDLLADIVVTSRCFPKPEERLRS